MGPPRPPLPAPPPRPSSRRLLKPARRSGRRGAQSQSVRGCCSAAHVTKTLNRSLRAAFAMDCEVVTFTSQEFLGDVLYATSRRLGGWGPSSKNGHLALLLRAGSALCMLCMCSACYAVRSGLGARSCPATSACAERKWDGRPWPLPLRVLRLWPPKCLYQRAPGAQKAPPSKAVAPWL